MSRGKPEKIGFLKNQHFRSSDNIRLSFHTFKRVEVKVGNSDIKEILVTKQNIQSGESVLGKNKLYDIVINNLKISFNTTEDRDCVYKYIKNINQKISIFVDGYRGPLNELSNTDNSITKIDRYDYWEGIDKLFITTKLKSEHVYYADGHMSITTSNHNVGNSSLKSIDNFAISWSSSSDAAGGKNSDQFWACISDKFAAPTSSNKCYHQSSCVKLHTKPNVTGFDTRMANGRIAGKRLVIELKNNGLTEKTDTIDVVCHSMGFAYAQGIIEVVKKELPNLGLGGYYIIAPENPSSGIVNPNEWKQIWQYGSNEDNPEKWLLDGVAPQCPVKNIGVKRSFIPFTFKKQGFLQSHKIVNYDWIFKLNSSVRGFVKPRK